MQPFDEHSRASLPGTPLALAILFCSVLASPTLSQQVPRHPAQEEPRRQTRQEPRCHTQREVMRELRGLRGQTSTERYATLRALVLGMDACSEKPTWDEKNETFRKIVWVARKRQYNELLEVLDDLKIHGGFANDVCDMYRALSREPFFVARYKGHTEALRRCRGLSFGSGEIESFL
jgi:hypothetical protein